MTLTLNIPDGNNPKVFALIEFLKTLDYASLNLENDTNAFELSNEQIEILDKTSAEKKFTTLADFKQKFKNKYGI